MSGAGSGAGIEQSPWRPALEACSQAFAVAAFEQLPLPDAELLWVRQFLSASEADLLFRQLGAQIAWEQHRLRIFGRWIDSPRLSSWIGDPGTAYRYSGTRFEPQPWPESLRWIRHRVERQCAGRFNSVLANRYRSGTDGMGFHADDEPELGPEPVIASLSLGATRRFVLKHRRERGLRLDLELPAGSLLLMRGPTQQHWLHALPKTRRPIGERINLTFRWIGAR